MTGVPHDTGVEQLQLIRRSSQFLRQRPASTVAIDPQCYLNSWAPGPGHARLRRLAYGWRAEPARLLAQLRDRAALLRLRDFAVCGENANDARFDRLVVSWALPGDFDADGGYRDRYFGVTAADTPRTLWFLVLLSGTAPARLPSNVLVFHRSTQAARSITRRPHGGFSGTVAQASDIASAVADCARRHGCRQILMPYEAQPFQHAVNLAVKAHDERIRTVGYLHSALPALPTDYLYRAGAPEQLLVHGEGQADILREHLGWPSGQLQIITSLRYARDASVPFAGRILLPYSFADADFIEQRVDAMLSAAAPGTMPRWQVRNHPVMTNSSRHLQLAERLTRVIARHAERASDAADVAQQTLMIGATAAVIEALERGLDVVHLCTNPLFERHCPLLWNRLQSDELAPNVYRYRLRERGAYIRFGDRARAGHDALEGIE